MATRKGAEVGYNQHKPGRPSHTCHTYMIANVHLILEVEVQAGKRSSSAYTAPGLWTLLDRIPHAHWPAFIRGDSDWGSDTIMTEAEQRGVDYLFKLKKSPLVKKLIHQYHCKPGWEKTHEGFCENNFDEIKNQWGWCGFVTQKLAPCRLIARMIALVYNWWSLFVRLVEAEKHYEAIVSKPLLLHGVGKQTQHAGKTTLTITSSHGRESYVKAAYTRVCAFFDELKAIAPQLTPLQYWYRILSEAMKKYLKSAVLKPPDLINYAS